MNERLTSDKVCFNNRNAHMKAWQAWMSLHKNEVQWTGKNIVPKSTECYWDVNLILCLGRTEKVPHPPTQSRLELKRTLAAFTFSAALVLYDLLLLEKATQTNYTFLLCKTET